MTNSLSIGKTLYRLLTKNQELKELVKGQVYPLLANESTTFPFIVYSRSDLSPQYAKGGLYEDEVTVTIIAVSNNYEQSIEVAQEVRNALAFSKYKDEKTSLEITANALLSVSEDTQDDSYLQTLTYKFNIR